MTWGESKYVYIGEWDGEILIGKWKKIAPNGYFYDGEWKNNE